MIDLLELSAGTHLANVRIYVHQIPCDPHQTENARCNDSRAYANTYTHSCAEVRGTKLLPQTRQQRRRQRLSAVLRRAS